MFKKTLIVGASLKPDRYSNIAIKRLIANGHEVKAIGIKNGNVLGVRIETGLPSFDEFKIDIVSLYLNAKRQKMYYDYLISQNPQKVIFNPGTENMEFVKLLKENDIDYEIACTLTLISTNQF